MGDGGCMFEGGLYQVVVRQEQEQGKMTHVGNHEIKEGSIFKDNLRRLVVERERWQIVWDMDTCLRSFGGEWRRTRG